MITGDHWLVTIGATDVLLQLLAGTGPTRERGGSFAADTGNEGFYVPPTALPPTFDGSGFWDSGAQQSPTPEPSSLFLLGSALLGMAAFGRRHLNTRAAKR
jgi:PEP-CTERM motif